MAVKQAIATEYRKRRVWQTVPFVDRTATPPLLASGDRLTRHEFERRYSAMPHVKKAELIEGVVHMPTPVSRNHGKAHGTVMTWLGTYCAATPGIELCDNATVRLDLDNEPQPDALLRLDEALGGRSRVGADDYIEGAPELIAEASASSASYDLHDKKNAYRRNGVQEYLVWRIYEGEIDWFRLHEGEYVPLTADDEGVVGSLAFPGLRLHLPAMLAGDLARVLRSTASFAVTELQKGLGTEEHRVFVERFAHTRTDTGEP